MENAPSLYSLAVTDIVLLLIMLVGLLRLRYRGGATLGLTNLLWKQVWLQFSLIVILLVCLHVFLS